MPINYEKLLALKIPDAEHTYTEKDTMLYALGVGLGHDPIDRAQLEFVYENNLKALPTYRLRARLSRLLGARSRHRHRLGARSSTASRAFACTGRSSRAARWSAEPASSIVIDKGAGQGRADLHRARDHRQGERPEARDRDADQFCRADGGFGGPPRQTAPVHRSPERAPDMVCDLVTRPEQALIYRLRGDRNPLHADPEVARKAPAIERPILHGARRHSASPATRWSRRACDGDAGRIVAIAGRFSAPVYPGRNHPHRNLARRQRRQLPSRIVAATPSP